MRYLDKGTRDEAAEAIRNGIDIARVAGQLGVSVDELQQLLAEPQRRPVPSADQSCDLWRADELKDVL